MKARENTVRLKRFQAREKRREIAQLEMMIAEFARMVSELEVQIVHEERKSGNNDIHHFAYSAFARAARKRCDNLTDSLRDLRLRKTNAEIVLHEIDSELQHMQTLEMREDKAVAGDNDISVQSCSMIG
ncbi:hypothetical protein BAnh1_09030 [Bartonella australis AUST/NH1]|uniref:Flagellar export protein FliJ n=1 Tax=Bartonella australis (strain Aust/NH1) TaxID=1094489 RepID=M1PDU8_BARAA|nr:hypothetical protein [Bartonella australis]AGF74776.1 hypothetical protein BAnh1_09030 [Bartonella australis AUST/NH1]